MPKEKSFNPAAAQRKADKQREIAKNKKQLQHQRNEKLARRNPERLQRQIDELKEIEQRGTLRPKDRETLAQLEKDVKGIRRARDALGDKAPTFPTQTRRDDGRQRDHEHDQGNGRLHSHLGKRRRDEEAVLADDDVPPDVLNIPMPRDTPPPFPRKPAEDKESGPRVPHALPTKPPVVQSKTVYSAAPQLRDLKKEAVQFMPAAVAAQRNRLKGHGRLLEPEELDKLEKAGYKAAQRATDEAEMETTFKQASSLVRAGDSHVDLDEEVRRFEEEISNIYPEDAEGLSSGKSRGVEVEEVEDEGD